MHELPSWLQNLLPCIFRPDFTWKHQKFGDRPITRDRLPRPPAPLSPFMLRIIGWCHRRLQDFSRYYCAWFGIPYRHWMADLPFGLLLKLSDGTSIDEVQSMRAIRAAGFPAPRVISYGAHPETPYAPVSILMTRLPGIELAEVFDDDLPDIERESIEDELRWMLDIMRAWPAPRKPEMPISSITGGSVRSIRVVNHRFGPFESEEEFTNHLQEPASSHSYESEDAFEDDLLSARKLYQLIPKHRIVFTHGDFALHNILVHDGHVSGWIDWESAGWYPDYWEFTTPLRWASSYPEWRDLLLRLGGAQYEAELECELAIRRLTVDAWIC